MTHKATQRHEDLRNDVIEVMRKYDDVPSIEQLAVLSVLLGQLIALQNGRKYDSRSIMKMVGDNIELGNAQAITAAAMGKFRI